nr:nuclear transport factor 2 family protein [Sphingomonas sp. CDS-1]
MSEQMTVIVRRHLDAWRKGDVDALLADYADDAVMMTRDTGVVAGKPRIRALYDHVFAEIFRPEDTRLEVTAELISGDHALVHWEATTTAFRTSGAFDAFTISDGKIVVQFAGMAATPNE